VDLRLKPRSEPPADAQHRPSTREIHMKRITIMTVLTAAALATTGTASADTADDFLSALHDKGIHGSGSNGDAMLVANALKMCTNLANGATMFDELQALIATGLSVDASEYFAAGAIAAWCPTEMSKVNDINH
jgi:hypothetical protein